MLVITKIPSVLSNTNEYQIQILHCKPDDIISADIQQIQATIFQLYELANHIKHLKRFENTFKTKSHLQLTSDDIN